MQSCSFWTGIGDMGLTSSFWHAMPWKPCPSWALLPYMAIWYSTSEQKGRGSHSPEPGNCDEGAAQGHGSGLVPAMRQVSHT
ncbi:hypothetical protein MC885_011084 [Smutsia gigantea]|nr:hypothetical protein MC885_011084 [Smutsia gigantea]